MLVGGCCCVLVSFVHRRSLEREGLLLPTVGIGSLDDRLAEADYLLAIGITLSAAASIRVIPQLYPGLLRHAVGIPLAISLATLLLALGCAAHVFKQKSKYWYGFTEAVVATLYIFDRCMQMTSIEAIKSNWATLVPAVYFLARGLNNWREPKQSPVCTASLRRCRPAADMRDKILKPLISL